MVLDMCEFSSKQKLVDNQGIMRVKILGKINRIWLFRLKIQFCLVGLNQSIVKAKYYVIPMWCQRKTSDSLIVDSNNFLKISG